MSESLPGNPTDAGPDTRKRVIVEAYPDWWDLMVEAEEELCFSRRRGSTHTIAERAFLRAHIDKAIDFLQQAKEAINAK
jgi:predicted Zn-dependent protease